MGYFLTHSRIYESIALIFVAFALVQAGLLYGPHFASVYQSVEPAAFEETIGQTFHPEQRCGLLSSAGQTSTRLK